MQKEPKLYFWDAAGKFDAVKEEARDACRDSCGNAYDLTIYSLTPKGETEPARLIVKMTPSGKEDSYLSARRLDAEEVSVSMLTLNYQTFPADQLKRLFSSLAGFFMYKNPAAGYAQFSQDKAMLNQKRVIQPIAVADFFGIDPREDEPGAQIYLRDKAFFLSMLPDPKKPDFSALPLLTDAQKAEVTSIDMTHADVSGRKSLARLFSGYRSIRQLDLSAFDTAGVTDMEDMFNRCYQLQRLDLSTFDFSQVEKMESMFCECYALKEVILSDTILGAGRIPHYGPYTSSYTTEYLNDLYRNEYIARGPELAEMAVKRLMKRDESYVPFHQATEEEVRSYLGLQYSNQKFTIVPHRASKHR